MTNSNPIPTAPIQTAIPTSKQKSSIRNLLTVRPTKLFFIGIHLACLAAFWVEITPTAIGLCIFFYAIRMWGVTAGYHRYFAHRTYKTSRVFQFILAFIGSSAVQKGVLWWSAHHRYHHVYSDKAADLHSPERDGFWWSHIGWILSPYHKKTDFDRVKDFAKYPELRWINKYHFFPVVLVAVICFLIGSWSGLVWGFFISTVLCSHVTFTINSLTHMIGKRRYNTDDTSRNHWLLALLSFGEGWHNNHHYYKASTRQGFFWWEIDISYYGLVVLSWIGIVWDIRTPSPEIRAANRIQAADQIAA